MFFLMYGDLPQSGPMRAALMQGDPTGLSTTAGKLVIAAGLLFVIILAVRWFWDQRNR